MLIYADLTKSNFRRYVCPWTSSEQVLLLDDILSMIKQSITVTCDFNATGAVNESINCFVYKMV